LANKRRAGAIFNPREFEKVACEKREIVSQFQNHLPINVLGRNFTWPDFAENITVSFSSMISWE